MNARVNSIRVVESLVRQASVEEWSENLLLPGFLMSEGGILLIALGNWILLNAMTQRLLVVCGGLLCLLGIVLIPAWLLYRSRVVSESRLSEEAEGS
jgi:uncharacterized membrane protein